MDIKKIFAAALTCAMLVTSSACFVSCEGDSEDTETESATQNETDATETQISYADVDIAQYVKKVTYKGLKVMLEDEDASKEQVLWDRIYATVEISSYPEDKVKYYFNQTKKAYMHIVGDDEEDYWLLLKNRGTDEEKMMQDAREMVKQDLVYRYILAAESVALTDEEKTVLFDKYVDKYVIEFNKSREYIVENMADYIYESMLYDKTMEFLMVNNEFEVADTSETLEGLES